MRRRHYFQYGFLDKKKEYLVSEPVCVPYTEYSLFVNTFKLMTLPAIRYHFKILRFFLFLLLILLSQFVFVECIAIFHIHNGNRVNIKR